MLGVGPEQVQGTSMLNFGNGMHSPQLPQLPYGAPARPTWWTEARIESTVTMQFVANKLRNDEQPQLHRPLSFGDGLTSDTYLEFILERARKLFLILSEIGAANKIFSIIDGSYDDNDLPIPLNVVPELGLSSKGDDKLDRKFYVKQHEFLLRELSQGEHIDYLSVENVPLEPTYRLPAAQSLHNWTRVRLPGESADMLARRQIAVQRPDMEDTYPDDYFDDMDTMKMIQHPHVIEIWGSYTYKGNGYVLTPFVAEHTLKSFFDDARSAVTFRSMHKIDQQRLLVEWMHCLAETVTYLHQNGFQHTAIRPSNIVIDQNNKLAFSELGSLKAFQRDKKIDPVEVYNYGAPEAHLGERYVFMNSSNRMISTSLFRKRSQHNDSSSDESHDGPYEQHRDMPFGMKRAQTLSSVFSFSNLNSSLLQVEKSTPYVDAQSLHSSNSASSSSSYATTEKTDIFSLGCIFVELLTCMHKLKPNELTKHIRSVRRAQKGINTARFDTSYHANIPRVLTWLKVLENRAFDLDERVFRAVPSLNRLIRSMLSHDPELRPSAAAVKEQIRSILTQSGGFEDDDLHCCSKGYAWENRSSIDTDPSIQSLTGSGSAPSLPSVSSLPDVRQSFLMLSPDGLDFYHDALRASSVFPHKPPPISIGHPSITSALDLLPPPVPPKSSKRSPPTPNFSRRFPRWASETLHGL